MAEEASRLVEIALLSDQWWLAIHRPTESYRQPPRRPMGETQWSGPITD